MNNQNCTSSSKFGQTLQNRHTMTHVQGMDPYREVLLRHYHVKEILRSVLSEEELQLLVKILVEKKVTMKLSEKDLGYIDPDRKVFESLYEKIYGPLWEKYE